MKHPRRFEENKFVPCNFFFFSPHQVGPWVGDLGGWEAVSSIVVSLAGGAVWVPVEPPSSPLPSSSLCGQPQPRREPAPGLQLSSSNSRPIQMHRSITHTPTPPSPTHPSLKPPHVRGSNHTHQVVTQVKASSSQLGIEMYTVQHK